jgi:hypothetical protein
VNGMVRRLGDDEVKKPLVFKEDYGESRWLLDPNLWDGLMIDMCIWPLLGLNEEIKITHHENFRGE